MDTILSRHSGASGQVSVEAGELQAGPRGELWFAAHSRAAREEMASLASELVTAIRRTGHISPDLQTLLAAPLLSP